VALQGLVIGQTSQPTALGFVVVCAGLMLAACNRPASPPVFIDAEFLETEPMVDSR
jgi:hypothetical protein